MSLPRVVCARLHPRLVLARARIPLPHAPRRHLSLSLGRIWPFSRKTTVDPERDYLLTRGGPLYKYRRSKWQFLFLILPAFAFYLGVWQMRRLRWKNDLIAELSAKIKQEAIRLPRQVNLDAVEEFSHRRVAVRGRFDHDREVLVGPTRRKEFEGYEIVTPFVRNVGNEPGEGPAADILINRGFVRKEYAPRKARPKDHDFSEQVIVGFLRAPKQRPKRAPKNVPERGQWPYLDPRELSGWLGTSPLVVEEIFVGGPSEIETRAEEGHPVGTPPTIELHNMHAIYAGTWFSLGTGTLAMAIFLLSA